MSIKEKKRNRIKDILSLLGKFLIAVLIFGWLIRENWTSFHTSLTHIDPIWLILALLSYFIPLSFSAFRWYLLLKIQGIRASFFEAFSLSMQGNFFSLVIPGGAIGGDLVRTTFLVSRTPKGNKLAATSTVFMDRFLGMIAQFSLTIVLAILFIPQIERMDNIPQTVVIIILIVSILGLIAGACIFLHRYLDKITFFRFFINLGNKLTRGLIRDAMDVMDVYNNKKKIMFWCIMISIFLVQLQFSLTLYCIVRGISCVKYKILPLLISIAMGNTAGLLPITPGGLGTRDAVVKASLTVGGYTHGEALAIPLIYSVILVITSLVGGLFFLFHKRSKTAYKIEK